MANENQPLLHFGDEIEDTNNSKNEQSSTTQIRFGEPAEEPAKPQQPVSQKPVTTPTPSQPVVQQVRQEVKPVTPPNPVRPVTQQPERPKTAPAAAAPKNDSFGKKNTQINLIVVNGAGVVIPQFKIDHTVVKSGQEITFNDSREVYEITVSADGYKERRVQITQTDLIKGEKRISLATQLQSFVVSFNTPDGIKRGSVDIDQTNAIYDFIKDASHTDTPLNELVIGGVGGHKPTQTKNPYIPYIVSLIVGLILGVGISSLFSCGGSKDGEQDKTEVVQEEVEEEKDKEVSAKDGKETLDPQAEEEKQEESKVEEVKVEEKKPETEETTETTTTTATLTDVDTQYLKTKDIWKREEAKGDEAKKLLAAFCSGNINVIIGPNAYNNLPEKQRNGYYNKVLADLKKISTQDNVEDAKAALRETCSAGEINLVRILNRTHPMLRK